MALPINIPFDRMEMRQDPELRTDGQAVYQGFTAPGSKTSEARWTIYKYDYTGSFITRRQVVFKTAWDNRAAAGVFQ